MARWLITVNSNSLNYISANRAWLKVNGIRAEFLGAGFTVTDYVGLYYTPMNRQRFYVQHAKESAMTLFLLGFNSTPSSFTVEQLD
jgi:hypothetical protein